MEQNNIEEKGKPWYKNWAISISIAISFGMFIIALGMMLFAWKSSEAAEQSNKLSQKSYSMAKHYYDLSHRPYLDLLCPLAWTKNLDFLAIKVECLKAPIKVKKFLVDSYDLEDDEEEYERNQLKEQNLKNVIYFPDKPSNMLTNEKYPLLETKKRKMVQVKVIYSTFDGDEKYYVYAAFLYNPLHKIWSRNNMLAN